MAFLRFANAMVAHPSVSQHEWNRVRSGSRIASNPSRDLVAQASQILGHTLDPSRYLLSHATIVCSVDTDSPPNVRLGKVKEGGKTINRRWASYYIKPDCSKYVNNNGDAWSRPVLLKSFRTFIGAQNFLEHVQVEDLSKGRIIDAVPRDLGESLYIDILVATDRKHTDLIADIESGKMAAMSMGCNVDHTTCTMCGNVAVDETEMCEHVRYQKLNRFIDSQGQQRIIAELCGHESEDPTGGVTFIEASWVANPAFKGAVMRNILVPSQVSDTTLRQAQQVLASPPLEWTVGGRSLAAKIAEPQFDFTDGEDGGAAPEAPKPEVKPDPLSESEERIYKELLNRVEQRVTDALDKKAPRPSPETSSIAPNDSVNKVASVKRAYVSALTSIIASVDTDIDLVERVAALDTAMGVRASNAIYRTALRVGAVSRYASEAMYLSACGDVLRRDPSQAEADALVRVGRILNHAVKNHRTDNNSRSQR